MKTLKIISFIILTSIVCSASANDGRRNPSLSDFPAGTKFLALTFDDGPTTNETVKILDELRRLDPNAKVTFYVNGAMFNAQTLPVLRRMIAEGHDVDNHGFNHYTHGNAHPDSPVRLDTPEKARENMQRNSQAIFDATGYWPFSFRAPFFEWGNQLRGLDVTLNMVFVHAIYDTNDWSQSNQSNPQGMASALIASDRVRDGAIILMHDAPAGARQGTVNSLQHFIPQLIAQGYAFVTVRELFMIKQYQPERFTSPFDIWNPNARVPFNAETGGNRGAWAHQDFWPNNTNNWWLQDWWTCSTPPWERTNGEICNDDPTSIHNTANKETTSFAGIQNGKINLQLQAGNYTAELYSLQGFLISKVEINATNGINATGLRTDNLSKGMFILNVKQEGTPVLSQKVFVE